MKSTACVLQIMLQIGTCSMVKHYNTSSDKVLWCESIKCRGVLEFCKENFTLDICNPCPLGTFMVDTVDSRYFENDRAVFRCMDSRHWSCPPEAEMVYSKITDTLQPPCECDRSRGYYGSNYNNCELVDEPCDPGLELSKRGNCVPCPSGTFKPTKTFVLCQKKTRCASYNRYTINPGSTTTDAKCGPLFPTSTIKGHNPFINVDIERSTSIDLISIPFQSESSGTFADIFTKQQIFLIIILIPAVILIIVGPIAIGFCIRNRYSFQIKCCMEINRKSDRKPCEIPLRIDEKASSHGSIHSFHGDGTSTEMDRRLSDCNVARITVHLHGEREADDVRNDVISDQSRNADEFV